MSAAREEVLGRVRRALEADRRPDQRAGEYAALPRNYRAAPAFSPAERLDRFEERLRDYNAAVHRCVEAELPEVIARILAERGKEGLLIPLELPDAWLPGGYRFLRDDGMSYGDLDASEGVLTGCALAIAETGTLVVRHSPEHGRRALTLVPDYHLCVVREEQVVETVPEAIRRMTALAPAPLTTISGPSATSDIEMTRIKGVHGPRTLEVILVKTADTKMT